MENTANHITLTGTLASLPEYSHQNHERRFFRFLLAVERLSGTEDLLPVLAAEDVLEQAELFEGERFTIEGQIRSFNNREPTGRRLILCVYALSMTTTDAPMQNEAVLTGTVCKPPVYRQTPLGRQITDLCLAVPRLYRRTDYIPCILWGRTALAAAEYPTGTELTLTGPAGTNVIAVCGGEVYMKRADCPDQICVKHGPLTSGGGPIVCLPNRLSIEWLNAQTAVDAVSGGGG